ncbi:MAG: metal ABC transporter permease, partial [Thermoleophilaceae bacterium]|nr:metal ABC transporter permease [Thermoleophilaceae bacterium]
AVAVVVTGLLGLGVLLALSPRTPAGLSGLLFGDVLGGSDTQLAASAAFGALLVAALAVLHPRLAAVAFDRDGARGLGISPGRADLAVLALIALASLVAVQAFGNLLVVAVLVAPAAAARLVTRRLAPMMVAAAGVAAGCGVVGLYASFHLHTAAGASVAAVMVLAWCLATALARTRTYARRTT